MMKKIDDHVAEQIRESITEAINSAIRDKTRENEVISELVIAATQVGLDHSQELLSQAVLAARHAGVSWSEIGDQLGVTKQAAQQRYGVTKTPVVGATQRLLKPVTALNEMAKLADAGAHGWHSISYGWLYHLLEKSDQQWEHHRDGFPIPGNRKRLEAHGWTWIGTTYPWQYFKRPLDTPAFKESL